MMVPVDYALCDRTVTVYHRQGDTVVRRVIADCYYVWQDMYRRTDHGARFVRTFLLVMPGSVQQIFAGDRVIDGVGPAVTAQDWDAFIPINVPTLSEAAYACPWYWDGRICHVEAGRK